MRTTTRNVATSMAALLLAGCASYQHPVAPLDAQARSALGSLSVQMASAAPTAPATPPPAPDRGEVALRAAGASIMRGMSADGDPTSSGLLLLLGIALAPFFALGEAIAVPSDSGVPEAGAAIADAITGIRWDAAFRDQVEKALAKHGHPVEASPSPDASRLKLSIRGPWLVVDSYTAIPTLTVHGELVAGDACLIDRRWRWNGDADDYADLGEDRARAYRTQMEKGLAMLAEAVVADLLVSGKPRLTAYRSEAAVKPGGRPLLDSEPMDFQEQVGSWDTQSTEPCSGILAPAAPALEPHLAAPEPPANHCQALGCRRDQ